MLVLCDYAQVPRYTRVTAKQRQHVQQQQTTTSVQRLIDTDDVCYAVK
jgi:hypothetical protein